MKNIGRHHLRTLRWESYFFPEAVNCIVHFRAFKRARRNGPIVSLELSRWQLRAREFAPREMQPAIASPSERQNLALKGRASSYLLIADSISISRQRRRFLIGARVLVQHVNYIDWCIILASHPQRLECKILMRRQDASRAIVRKQNAGRMPVLNSKPGFDAKETNRASFANIFVERNYFPLCRVESSPSLKSSIENAKGRAKDSVREILYDWLREHSR